MQFTLATVALAAASLVSAQGAANGLAPSSPPPAGCVTTYPSKFEITVYLAANTKRELVEREPVTITLTNGVLTDAYGRIGGIVANRQFQFDGPPSQTGTIYNAGWSVCQNGSLAIGGSALFYECGSGGFYNLYDSYIGAQCLPIEIDVVPVGTAPAVTQTSDGQVQASSAVTQITDGQIQATSANTRPAVTQIGDGQIQATLANTRPVVSQYTDGQLQVGTAQPTVTAIKVTQIGDGQIQAPTTLATRPPVITQIGDGQIQAPNGTARATATKSVVTAGAAQFTMAASFMAAAGAVAGLAFL